MSINLSYSRNISQGTHACNKAYLAFLSRIFTIHWAAGEEGGYLLIPFLTLPPASQTLKY